MNDRETTLQLHCHFTVIHSGLPVDLLLLLCRLPPSAKVALARTNDAAVRSRSDARLEVR